MLGHAAGVLLAVLATAVIARHLGVRDSGRFITVISLSVLATNLLDAGLQTVGLREYAVLDAEPRAALMPTLIVMRLALASVAGAATVLYALLVGFSTPMVLGCAVSAVAGLLQTLYLTLSTALLADLRMGWASGVEVIRQLTTTSAVVVLAILGGSFVSFFAAGVIGAMAALGVTWWVVGRRRIVRGGWQPSVALTLLRETYPFAIATAVAAAYTRVTILVVQLIAGPEQTGYFGVSTRVTEGLVAVPALAVGVAFPVFARAARNDPGRLTRAVQRALEVSVLMGVGVAAAVAVGAGLVVDVITGGGDFRPAAGVLRVQAIGVGLAFVSAVLTYALLALRQHVPLLVVSVIGLAVVLSGGVIGSYQGGAAGAAVGTSAGELALTLAALVAVRRSGLDLRLRVLPRVLVCLIVAGVPALLLPAWGGLPVFALVYASAAWLLGLVRPLMDGLRPVQAS